MYLEPLGSGGDNRLVYDCFPFFNEVDILKLRLHIMDPYVDRFVIEESTVTFSGEPKELLFEKHKDLFKEFLDKITYIVVDDTPIEGADTYERDYYQKNNLIKGLKDATSDDVIIMSDVDEIPCPETLQKIIAEFDKNKVYHLAQRNFYVYMNNEEKSGKLLSITKEFPEIPEDKRLWLGSKICNIDNIPKEGIVRLRDLVPVDDPRSVRVANGGWHFGYMGGLGEKDPMKRIGIKTKAAAHQNFNEREVLAETMDHLILGMDIFGRDAHFERVEIDDTYPEYLREHLDEYQHFVLKKITPAMKFVHRMDMTVGRFFRKAIHKVFG
jgi:beta-1,4-mannosyl-glycoprotein beta-1,4-N-acetylglucosaminyltransferase